MDHAALNGDGAARRIHIAALDAWPVLANVVLPPTPLHLQIPLRLRC